MMFSLFKTVAQTPVNIIFLDINGVLLRAGDTSDNILAYQKHLQDVKDKLGSKFEELDLHDIGAALRFNRIAIENLRKLCKNYDAKIVISSSWRIYNDREGSMNKLTSLFKLWDLDSLIIDVTPSTHKSRGHEIQQWLSETKHRVGSYVILDDIDDELSTRFGKKYIYTGDTRYFSSKHYDQAAEIFAPNPASIAEEKPQMLV